MAQHQPAFCNVEPGSKCARSLHPSYTQVPCTPYTHTRRDTPHTYPQRPHKHCTPLTHTYRHHTHPQTESTHISHIPQHTLTVHTCHLRHTRHHMCVTPQTHTDPTDTHTMHTPLTPATHILLQYPPTQAVYTPHKHTHKEPSGRQRPIVSEIM